MEAFGMITCMKSAKRGDSTQEKESESYSEVHSEVHSGEERKNGGLPAKLERDLVP